MQVDSMLISIVGDCYSQQQPEDDINTDVLPDKQDQLGSVRSKCFCFLSAALFNKPIVFRNIRFVFIFFPL